MIGLTIKDEIITTATINETVEKGTTAIIEITTAIITITIAVTIAVTTDVTINKRTISISPETARNIKIAISTTAIAIENTIIIRIRFTS